MDARLIYLVEIWEELDWITRKRIDLIRFWCMNRRVLAGVFAALLTLIPTTQS